jgi:hypothetical protein
MTWREVIRTAHGRWSIAFSVACLTMMVFYMPVYYRDIIGPKQGLYLDDPLLKLFKPIDWSALIFLILYLSVAHLVFSSIRNPNMLLVALTTYFIIAPIRMLTMYLFTLEPPKEMILLIDPVIAFLVYPDSGFAKDLFFSGHVSAMTAMALVEGNRIARMIKFIAACLVGLLLAWQQVHYTIDLLVAPLVTYIIFLGVQKFLGFGATVGITTKME